MKKTLLFLAVIFISENLVSQNKTLLTDDTELIKDLNDLSKAYEINRYLKEYGEFVTLSYMNEIPEDIDDAFANRIAFCENISTHEISNDSLRIYIDNYILESIKYDLLFKEGAQDSINIKVVSESYYKASGNYFNYLHNKYSTKRFIDISEKDYWINIESNQYITRDEYRLYDSIKMVNIPYAIKYLDSISLLLDNFQEYSIYQIEIANQYILNDSIFEYNHEVALRKYLEILDKKEYSLYLFESWRRWRCVYQNSNGHSKFSDIPNEFYNQKRSEVLQFLLNYITFHPDDDMAINQYILLSTHDNVLRFGEYDYGNQNILEYYYLYKAKFDF
jgi:hypothetical protein